MIEYLQLKKELILKCTEHVEGRIKTIQTALDLVHESKLTETKSSAGDKFETGRSHMQMKEQNLHAQMVHARQDADVLSIIVNRTLNDQVGPGNLVSTTGGIYFITVGIGKIKIDGTAYYCVSAQSPIGTALIGKVIDDEIVFNGRVIKINGIF